jgi:hypothetical protein
MTARTTLAGRGGSVTRRLMGDGPVAPGDKHDRIETPTATQVATGRSRLGTLLSARYRHIACPLASRGAGQAARRWVA